jgi:hypothetical protein
MAIGSDFRYGIQGTEDVESHWFSDIEEIRAVLFKTTFPYLGDTFIWVNWI